MWQVHASSRRDLGPTEGYNMATTKAAYMMLAWIMQNTQNKI